jgi:hypothetical protein
LTLFFRDGSQQVLNFGNALSHKGHNRDIRNARDPGVADELEVQRC